LDLRGELCAETIGVLERHVDMLGCCGCEELTIDLTRLDRIDVTGARVLLGLEHYLRGRGGRLTVTGAADEARALLEAEGSV
jgi:anti-anti-sigma regulatory factor